MLCGVGLLFLPMYATLLAADLPEIPPQESTAYLPVSPAELMSPPLVSPPTLGLDHRTPSVAHDDQTTLFVDLLYWKLTAGSAENWAQEITPQGLGTSYGTAQLIDAPFQWNAGFRVGASRQDSTELFDTALYYTHYNTSAENRAAGEVYSAFLGNFYTGNPDGTGYGPHYRSATIDWGVQFHTIDLEIGRTFEVSSSLSLRPFVGLKSAIIRQSIQSTWFRPIDTSSETYLFDSATENLTQNFWGIGPAIGVEARIPLRQTPQSSLQFYAAPSGSLMYGQWDFSDRFQTDGPTSLTFPLPTSIAINSQSIHGAATMLRGCFGLEWRQDRDRCTTTLRVGYEAQIWLNQMQYYSFNMGRLNNLMALQGGTFEFELAF